MKLIDNLALYDKAMYLVNANKDEITPMQHYCYLEMMFNMYHGDRNLLALVKEILYEKQREFEKTIKPLNFIFDIDINRGKYDSASYIKR